MQPQCSGHFSIKLLFQIALEKEVGGTTSFQLKLSTSNPGVVTSDVGGINCGTACQANYATSTAVTLTATPPAGKTFASWSGACAGTTPICTVTVNANLSAKANFNK